MLDWALLFIALAGLLFSSIYLLLAMIATLRFTMTDTAPRDHGRTALPPVTILKPLKGTEPLLKENLESFFCQQYPSFELIFGARDGSDPALQVVEALRQKYPEVKGSTILTGEPAYANAKVYAPGKMLAVLVGDLLEGMRFALGPGMATRKDILARLGGIEVLGAYCSDDFVLGQLTHAAGKKVVLSRHVIDHVVLNRPARASLLHRLRWMRSARFSPPLGHIGMGITFAMPFGLLGMAAGPVTASQMVGSGLLAVAVLNWIIQCLAVGWQLLRDSHSPWFCWLYPLRDLLGFFLWCASFFGAEIVWRDERYKLLAGGKMVRKIVQSQVMQFLM